MIHLADGTRLLCGRELSPGERAQGADEVIGMEALEEMCEGCLDELVRQEIEK